MPQPNVRKEATLFAVLLFAGLALLPGAIYYVGNAVFGEFGGSGPGSFYGQIFGHLAAGEASVWFLVLSPYLVWQLLRMTVKAFRLAGAG
ncbi:MAG: hypothetical protein OEV41_07830 [Gammaproteobacteria bacterium]|nr:hypothetical protein [Gammaproteobacteria bacterium]MDH5345136.1 hypothetical protein [Gammaproteobacteria bacterium]